jgi:hypothetical protein
MFKIAMETHRLKDEFVDILVNMNIFEFEDRKHMMQFIVDIYTQFKEVIEDALEHRKVEVVSALINKYEIQGMSTFIGQILRLYTKSNKLIDAFLSLDVLGRLVKLITNPDFNIQSDAYETFKEVLLYDRGEDANPMFEQFLIDNYSELFKLFDLLENDPNYFSKREGLKTQYMLLARNETLRKYYTADKERLKGIMVTVLNQNKGIQYEAFLLLSLFILMPHETEAVRYTLKMNRGQLSDLIKNFQQDRDEADFKALKNRMREVLDDMDD